MIDRSAQRRSDAEWLADAWTRSRVLVVQRGHTLARRGALGWLSPDRAPDGERLFLGVDDSGTPYFAVLGELPTGDDVREVNLREALELPLSDAERGLLAEAVALANWHDRHAYHPGTGRPTTARDGGWVRAADDDEPIWPRTDPAMIVLVHDGVPGDEGRCLLARNAARPMPFRSCLAGFVEPGESLEDTVVREVYEEVGLRVRDVTYFSSQAWPFHYQLMVGFYALADPEAPLRLDPAEIAEAAWYTRAQLRSDDAPRLPGHVSISRHLIENWLAERV